MYRIEIVARCCGGELEMKEMLLGAIFQHKFRFTNIVKPPKPGPPLELDFDREHLSIVSC